MVDILEKKVVKYELSEFIISLIDLTDTNFPTNSFTNKKMQNN